jgi:hypothetical protein
MGRAIAQSQLSPSALAAEGLVYALATTDDEADLRALLRDHPMGGWIALSLEREPRYFAAAALEGDVHQTLIVREADSGAAVGLFSRSVRDAFLDGSPTRLGYLGQLRIVPRYRHKIRHLRQGFAALRALVHDAAETPFYLTSIVEDNHAARRILGARLSAMPIYEPRSPFLTLALVPSARHGRYSHSSFVDQACAADMPAIAACLQRNYARFQFAPVWSAARLSDPLCCPNLQAEDFWIVRDQRRVIACLALWDQRAFKQSVVRGYAPALARLRPFANALAPLLGLPRLPPVGDALDHVFLSHMAIDEDHADLSRPLLGRALEQAARLGFALATFGLSPESPWLQDIAGVFRWRAYRSHLYTVSWPDGAWDGKIDERPAHVEVATL